MSTGSCLCSHVKYTFTGEPVMQAICHCHACHKISGSAFTTCLIVPSGSFKITSGTHFLKDFSFPHESGMTITIHFCTNCGSCVYKEGDNEASKGTLIIQAGTLDKGGMEFGDVKLGAELWVKQRAPWLEELKGVAQLQQFS